MSGPADAAATSGGATTSRGSSRVKRGYLVLYNLLSAGLWAIVLGRSLRAAPTGDSRYTLAAVGDETKWIQTLAGLEVLHAVLGLVRAPILTTVMQVASRFLLVWGIVHPFPNVAASSFAYTTMLLAWSATEVVRYTYFAMNLTADDVPPLLMWLRYNAFFVLYPLGISSECWLVWQSQGPASQKLPGSEWVLRAILLIYIPGSYILFTHMMAQRRKVMRSNAAKKTR